MRRECVGTRSGVYDFTLTLTLCPPAGEQNDTNHDMCVYGVCVGESARSRWLRRPAAASLRSPQVQLIVPAQERRQSHKRKRRCTCVSANATACVADGSPSGTLRERCWSISPTRAFQSGWLKAALEQDSVSHGAGAVGAGEGVAAALTLVAGDIAGERGPPRVYAAPRDAHLSCAAPASCSPTIRTSA